MSNSYLPPVVDIVRTGDAVRAETARTGAETARTGAETARTGAETARTGAETARTAAETARTAAETARDNAQAASASAAASYDAFDDRYLGGKASDPTLDNDGAPLITGALYWSTTLNNLRFWSGTVWVPTNSTFTQAVADTRYLQLTGGALTGSLSGTTGTFTTGLSAANITAYGPTNSVGVQRRDNAAINSLFYSNAGSTRLYASGVGTVNDDLLRIADDGSAQTLNVSGTHRQIWHAGNFNPASYAPLAGATFTGGIGGTTGLFSGVVVAAAATDPSHLLNRGTADARYNRITTSPTALAGGATIPGTENGRAYSLALPTHQTCALPSTIGLPDGFSCVLRVTGAPAAFQQAFVNGNGKLISYRGSSLSVFYLYGFDETFRFTWFSSLNVWVAECLLQPSSGIAASFTSNVNAWNGSPTAWTSLLSFGNTSAFTTNYAFVPNFFSVAVTGIYTILGYAQFSAGAGGGVSGVGYIAGGTNSGSDTSRGFSQHAFNTTDGDGATLQVTWTEVLQPNDLRAPYFLASAAALYTYLSGNYSIIKLLER